MVAVTCVRIIFARFRSAFAANKLSLYTVYIIIVVAGLQPLARNFFDVFCRKSVILVIILSAVFDFFGYFALTIVLAHFDRRVIFGYLYEPTFHVVLHIVYVSVDVNVIVVSDDVATSIFYNMFIVNAFKNNRAVFNYFARSARFINVSFYRFTERVGYGSYVARDGIVAHVVHGKVRGRF